MRGVISGAASWRLPDFQHPQVRVQTAAFYEGAVAMLETCGFDDQEFFAHYRVTPSQIMSPPALRHPVQSASCS